jgi:DNA-binding IclR family transcriptional regulator
MLDGEKESLAPAAERVIGDAETLKALSDPIRLRILEAMVQAADESWTVKRIANALGVGPTKLYHHIRILEETELIRPAGQQLVRGIVETSYRIAQLQVRLDPKLFAVGGAEVRASAEQTMTTLFELARRDVLRASAAGLLSLEQADDPKRMFMLRRSLLRTTPERGAELRQRLAALLAEYDDDPAGEVTLGLFVSLHPLASETGR